ncbi:uncharacterized protein LOC124419431 isoform X1 [Lucilia cuprina]|uniref:uncharacterized protein LOC124419431 isoform X1 n=1 Tax=Lucilia cuprina TaxID=7375 RepID=UPI001F05D579|nr:uncharacterized protein LOC124419431 isoform X1 [Lucilia cuprina]
MDNENMDKVLQIFNNILGDSEALDEAVDEEFYCSIFGREPPKPPHMEINFEKYLRDTYKGKIKLLQRSTFHQIKRPTLIMFNHFQQKCAYLAKWLHLLSQLSNKYDNCIEFLAADMLDIDIMHKEWKSLDYICKFTSPERQAPYIFAIDQSKRIYQYNNSNKSLEYLMEFCEQFLSGKLCISEPLPLDNDKNLVKICVYQNYEELVLKSNKHILLVVGKRRGSNPYDTNYEKVALALKDYNLEVCYLIAEKKNKNIFTKFGYGCRKDEYVIKWLKQQIENSVNGIEKYNETDKPISDSFDNLEKYLTEHFDKNIKIFNREYFYDFQLRRKNILLIFVSLQFRKSSHFNKYLEKLQELQQNFKFEVEISIADYRDFDIIKQDYECDNFSYDLSADEIKIYAFDIQQNIYQYDCRQHLDTLYYFLNDLCKGQLYYSQLTPEKLKHNHSLVTTCTADNLKLYVKNCKRHIGLFVYNLNYKDNDKILLALENIARNVKKSGVKILKINAVINYIPLEYRSDQYPVFYFISRFKKRKICCTLSRNSLEIIDFIKTNVKESEEKDNK